MNIRFEINREPKGKGRPRAFMMGKGAKARISMYTPDDTRAYEDIVKAAYLEEAGDLPPVSKGVPVKAVIQAYFKIPKSASKKKRKELLSSYCLKAPDGDNIAKAVLDALNKIAYHDDSQVSYICVIKKWAEESSVVVTLFT